MSRLLLYGTLAASLLGTLQAAPPQQNVFRGGVDVVRVFVTVTDRDGRLVTTLKQSDFELRDEGKPQPITLFDNTPQPIRLVVLLDVSGCMAGYLGLLRSGTEQLFIRLLRDDVARVGSFGRNVTISRTGHRRSRSMVRISKSSVVGSIQCASSRMNITGRCFARPPNSSLSATKVRSFCSRGVRLSAAYRPSNGSDRSVAKSGAT